MQDDTLVYFSYHLYFLIDPDTNALSPVADLLQSEHAVDRVLAATLDMARAQPVRQMH